MIGRHCSACHQRIKPKHRRPIKQLVNGVMVWANGREKDTTRKARERRRERIWKRDHHRCQQTISVWPFVVIGEFGGNICGRIMELSQAHIHHIHKRSLGRDDRDKNQVTICPDHHQLYDSKLQWTTN